MTKTIGTRRLVAACAGLALVLTGIGTTAALASAQPPAAVAQAVAKGPVGVDAVAPGTGTLFFDWGCDGSYSSVSITFNADGTFSTGSGSTGIWVNIAGFITFTYAAPSETTYSAVVASRASAGVNTTFAGLNGCHHIVGAGVALAGMTNDSRLDDGTLRKS